MGLLTWLFGEDTLGDNRARGKGGQEAARKLDGAMPMAAAGAQLSGKNDESETDQALKRASRDHGDRRK